jgi:hypothetical protein
MSTTPKPPKRLATTAPIASPIQAGDPKMIANGKRESATLTWKIEKLIGASAITPTAYRAAKNAVKKTSIRESFAKSILPTPGFIRRNGWEGHSPA